MSWRDPDAVAALERLAAPFALPVDEFRVPPEQQPAPLLGAEGDVLVARGGLVVIAGQPGVGKTTLLLDLVWHLAAGIDWLGNVCDRPLNVLLIENEGPRTLFAGKVDRKLSHFEHELQGSIYVQTWRWGYFSFTDPEAVGALGAFVTEHEVDVIVGDPLGSLGPGGVGSPEDTRRFVAVLGELQLDVGWLFVHHFRKEPTPQEIDQLSGSWAGHLDTLLLVKPTHRPDELRLSFPKMRWSDRQRKPLILGYVRNTQGFELLGEEGDAQLVLPALVEALQPGEWCTPTELARRVNTRRTSVEAALAENAHLFTSAAGKDVGRPKAKRLWRLAGLSDERGQGADKEPDEQTTLLSDKLDELPRKPLQSLAPHLVPLPPLSRERGGEGQGERESETETSDVDPFDLF